MTGAQRDALVLEFAGETLPLADATNTGTDQHHVTWNATWLAANASSLTLANYRTTLPAAGTVNVCLRTTTQVCPGGTTPTLSTDATLSALALQDSNDNAIALSPAFDSATGAYTAMVYNQITALTLTAGKNDANATVTITSDDDTSTPGEAELNLSVGSNTLTVTVTAQSGATKTYTITVTRAAAPPAPSDCPADNTWCATMVVGIRNTTLGVSTTELSGYMSTISVGDLGSTMFTHGGDSYSVARVSQTKITALGSVLSEGLFLVADPALPDGTVLQVNTRTFTVGTDTATLTQPGQEDWDIKTNPMTWTAGQNVTVSLTLPSTLSDDATLSDLALEDAADGSSITLTPSTFVSTTKSYTADVVNSIDEITVEPTSDHNATFAYLNASDTALVDADSVEDGFQVDLSEGENTVKVKVTAEDDTTTDTYTVVVTRLRRVTTTPAAPAEIEVPNDWSLIPTGLVAGDKFRLLFLSSTKTDGESYDIADYNTFIQGLAAAGHTDIRTYSPGFRALGCTADSDARDNTATTGTGEVIHWLNGNKAADNYADFYNGNWDDEANDKDESGANGPNTSRRSNYPLTGCDDDGTEDVDGGTSYALGESQVRVARPSSGAGNAGPLTSNSNTAKANTRPMYGLSQVFEVGAAALSTDATLSGLALKNAADGSSITLTPSTFVSTTKSYTADVANDVDQITVEPTSDHNATFAYLNASDTALVDADSVEDGFQVDLLEGENTVKVKVTAEDDTTTDTYTVVVTRLRRVTTTPAAPAEIEVPNDWSLIPTGLVAGDKFRLLFLSSTKTDGESYDIADYNTFIQGLAAAGHTDIRTYSPGFRALGCTADSDARDNTATTGTGEVIHWLNGNKAADNYADFYNGNWDDEANDKDESGANGPNTSQSVNYPLTGCDDDGTEDVDGGTSYALGESQVRVARPSSGAGNAGPLTSNSDTAKANTRPMYGLSQVFEVGAAALSTDATLSGLALKNAADGSSITLTPSTFVSTTKSYTADVANDVDQITVEPTSDHNATFAYLNASDTALVDADSVEDGFQVDLLEGENTVKVKVTAEDDTTTDTYTVVVTRLRRVTTTPAAPAEIEVPNDWSLIPAGLVAGDKFRLLFLSSTKTDGESYDIADYNTFIQGLAAAGHTDIRTYSPGFRALGCTADSDARDNTATTGTGEVIHWLNGNQAADNYADFYNGNWDDEANDKDESGANGPNTSNSSNYPLTGCDDDGTEDVDGGTSYALGESQVRVARPSSGAGNAGPLTSNSDTAKANTRPMYGLSQVFEVAAAGNTSASGKPAITGTAQVGQTLTASKGTIADAEGTTKADAGDTGYAYTYQWVQVDGSTETAIPSETGTTYTPVAADVGKTIKVQASFKDDEDNAEGPLTSDATAAVVAAAPCDALWCATMTVGAVPGEVGFSDERYGTLTPSREFIYDGATVRVSRIYYEAAFDELYMDFDGSLGGSDYTLQLGELSFPLGDPGSSNSFDISTSDIDWTDGDTVTVKLFEGLEGGTLSDDATLSGLSFEFVNYNPVVPLDATDTVDTP